MTGQSLNLSVGSIRYFRVSIVGLIAYHGLLHLIVLILLKLKGLLVAKWKVKSMSIKHATVVDGKTGLALRNYQRMKRKNTES